MNSRPAASDLPLDLVGIVEVGGTEKPGVATSGRKSASRRTGEPAYRHAEEWRPAEERRGPRHCRHAIVERWQVVQRTDRRTTSALPSAIGKLRASQVSPVTPRPTSAAMARACSISMALGRPGAHRGPRGGATCCTAPVRRRRRSPRRVPEAGTGDNSLVRSNSRRARPVASRPTSTPCP